MPFFFVQKKWSRRRQSYGVHDIVGKQVVPVFHRDPAISQSIGSI
jgi:hypothetical protein